MQTQLPMRSRFGKRTIQGVPLQLNVDLLDAPGGTFASVPEVTRGAETGYWQGDENGIDVEDVTVAAMGDDLIGHLARCDGIVFLFDPIREQAKGDAYEYFQSTLLRIAQRRFAQSKTGLSKLPHHVAVCVTKFDDPEIYRRARLGGYRTYDDNDPYMFPRVHDNVAADFFADLCRQSNLGNADLVPRAIDTYFEPAGSAISLHPQSGSTSARQPGSENKTIRMWCPTERSGALSTRLT